MGATRAAAQGAVWAPGARRKMLLAWPPTVRNPELARTGVRPRCSIRPAYG